MKGRIRFGLLSLVLVGVISVLCGGCISGAISPAHQVVHAPDGPPTEAVQSESNELAEP